MRLKLIFSLALAGIFCCFLVVPAFGQSDLPKTKTISINGKKVKYYRADVFKKKFPKLWNERVGSNNLRVAQGPININCQQTSSNGWLCQCGSTESTTCFNKFQAAKCYIPIGGGTVWCPKNLSDK